MGYRAVLNGSEMRHACEERAAQLAASAMRISGIVYDINSRTGLTRIHTRVTTQTKGDFFKENKSHALSTVCGAAGGNVNNQLRRNFRK